MSAISDFPKGRRFLVTGASGFVGRHVVHALVRQGAVVFGVQRHAHRPVESVIPVANSVQICTVDLATGDIASLVARTQPEIVIHCAGLISAPQNDEGKTALRAANVVATERLLQAVKAMKTPPRVVLVSSAAIWAPMMPKQSRIQETHPIEPVSAYGASKAEATRLGLALHDQGVLDVAVGVPFNLLGPGQPAHLVPSAFIQQLRNNPSSLTLRDPEAIRDWLDVRDAAEALIALARSDVPPDLYNICSGQGLSVADLLSHLCRKANWQPAVQTLPGAVSAGVSRSVGDPSRLHATCDWRPKLLLDDTLADMLI